MLCCHICRSMASVRPGGELCAARPYKLELEVRQRHADRRSRLGRTSLHAAVHAMHGQIPPTICDHLRPSHDHFSTIYDHSGKNGTTQARAPELPVAWHPRVSRCAVNRPACAQHSILEQRCKENIGRANRSTCDTTADGRLVACQRSLATVLH